MNELAEDLAPLPAPLMPTHIVPQVQLPAIKKKPLSNEQMLSDIFPGYVPGGRLKFSELFASKVPKTYHALRLDPTKMGIKDTHYNLCQNDIDQFLKPMEPRFEMPVTPVDDEVSDVNMDSDVESVEEVFAKGTTDMAAFHPVILDAWEDKIIWTPDIADQNMSGEVQAASKFGRTAMFRNGHLEDDKWMNAIIWDDKAPEQELDFHMDDPKLVILQDEVEDIVNPAADKAKISLYSKRPDGKVIDRYNISDDWLYEKTKPRTGRVRQTYGPASLVHSLPAVMLHPHYFKPLLHVKDLRSHHRPSIKFPLKENFTFSRLKVIKKKKLKEIDPAEMMKTPKDLSLRDTSQFVLVEYCVR